MGYQFAHIYTYSGNGGKNGTFKVSGCLGEAFREEGYTSHIERTAEPRLLYGNREDVEKAVSAYQEGFRDARGHKLRKDGKTLLAGVFSWPPGTTKDQFVTGNDTLINYLKTEYGGALRCVLTHEDEPFLRGDHKGETHFHTHFMVVPEPSQNMKELHPGLKAKADARAEGKNVFEQDQTYKWAMGDWQDKINREVGAALGLIRLGPQQKRLSRREQKILDDAQKTANQIEIQAVAKAENQAISVYQTADRTLAAAEEKQAEARKLESAAKEKKAELDKREQTMNEGLNINLRKWNLPDPRPAERKKLPILGEVFTVDYLNRVYDWAAGLVAKVSKLMTENTEKKKELDKTLEEQKSLRTRMSSTLDRLDLKYGEAKQFEEWKRLRDIQKKTRDQEPDRGVKR